MEPDLALRYGAHDDAILDVHLPANVEDGPMPMVVLIHGGFWRARWDRTHTRAQAAALRDLGHVVITPEYRRAGTGGGWPQTFDDVRTAVTTAADLLADLLIDRVQIASTTVVGHSAGGHLALWLASDPAATAVVHRTVALAPVGDLAHAWQHSIGGSALADFLGGPLPAADPARLLGASAPVAEVVILHGDGDDEVPVANSDWVQVTDGVDLRVLPGVGHYEFLDPTSTAWPEVVAAVTGQTARDRPGSSPSTDAQR